MAKVIGPGLELLSTEVSIRNRYPQLSNLESLNYIYVGLDFNKAMVNTWMLCDLTIVLKLWRTFRVAVLQHGELTSQSEVYCSC